MRHEPGMAFRELGRRLPEKASKSDPSIMGEASRLAEPLTRAGIALTVVTEVFTRARAMKSGMIDSMSIRDALNRTLLWHFIEMVLAMAVGMAVFDEVASVLFSIFAHIDLFAYPLLFAPVMTVSMVGGMALWMLYRRHSPRSIGEMGGAMFIPLCLLIGPHWAGMLSASALLGGSMILMLPLMLGVMLYRREDYCQGYGSRSPNHQHHLSSTSS